MAPVDAVCVEAVVAGLHELFLQGMGELALVGQRQDAGTGAHPHHEVAARDVLAADHTQRESCRDLLGVVPQLGT